MKAYFVTFNSQHSLKHNTVGILAIDINQAREAAKNNVGENIKNVLAVNNDMISLEQYHRQYRSELLYSFMVINDDYGNPMYELINNEIYNSFARLENHDR